MNDSLQTSPTVEQKRVSALSESSVACDSFAPPNVGGRSEIVGVARSFCEEDAAFE